MYRPFAWEKEKWAVSSEKAKKKVARIKLDKQTLTQAHQYALYNCDELTPFRR